MQIELKNVKVEVSDNLKVTRQLFYIPKLQIQPNSKLLIHGPSGCGKSSLLHLIAGLYLPTHGDICWDQQSTQKMSDQTRSQIRRTRFAIIFQRLNLIEHLTVAENIRLALDPNLTNQTVQERIQDALKKVSMFDFINTPSHVLSLGEQQRVAIARALAQKPEVILADEPSSSLDQKNADLSMESIFNAAQNSSLIVVSHDTRIHSLFQNQLNMKDWMQERKSK